MGSMKKSYEVLVRKCRRHRKIVIQIDESPHQHHQQGVNPPRGHHQGGRELQPRGLVSRG